MGRTPDAVIDDGVFVFRGSFYLPDAAAIAPTQRAVRALKAEDAAGAVSEARKALALSPGNFDALLILADSLTAQGDAPGGREALQQAMQRVNEMEPSAQALWRPQLQAKLTQLAKSARP